MNSKSTWTWFLLAVALFGLVCLDQYLRKPQTGPAPLLPNLKTAEVTSVQVIPAGQTEIRAERTNAGWQLTRPLAYPAHGAAIQSLLRALERLTPATTFSIHELRQHPKADEEFGFDTPQATLILNQEGSAIKLLVGRRTPPGNQVYLQLVGGGDIYVVDADWLAGIPPNATAWRDPALVDLRRLTFDRLNVTNGANWVELERDADTHRWRMTRPIRARADNEHLPGWLQQLDQMRAVQFFDDPKSDLDVFGLQPPELTVAFGQGSNVVARLEFGRSPTNDASLVYARRRGWNSVLTVAKDLQAPWRAPKDAFRDPRVVDLSSQSTIREIEVQGEEDFVLQCQTNSTPPAWRLPASDFAVDAGLANELLDALTGLRIAQFVNDVATEADLPRYGLKTPVRQVRVRAARPPGSPTNALLADLTFGTNQDGRVFVRRADEDSIYEVNPVVLESLPAAAWRLRDRRLWDFGQNDVAGLTIREAGKSRQLVRDAAGHWSLAPGTQGILEDSAAAAIEEAVRQLAGLSASAWTARGAENLPRYGFKPDGYELTIDLKNGQKRSVQFGGDAPSHYPYGAIMLDGQPWIFEFPLALYHGFLKPYLSLPGGVP